MRCLLSKYAVKKGVRSTWSKKKSTNRVAESNDNSTLRPPPHHQSLRTSTCVEAIANAQQPSLCRDSKASPSVLCFWRLRFFNLLSLPKQCVSSPTWPPTPRPANTTACFSASFSQFFLCQVAGVLVFVCLEIP